MKNQFSDLVGKFITMHAQFHELRNENVRLVNDVEKLKVTANIQAAKICVLEAEVDDQNQYSRRENIIFTNLKADTNDELVNKVVDLCDQIGVTVEKSDISTAHPLPLRTGKRHVVRFINRSKVQDIFKHRKNCKNIDQAKKRAISHKPDKGIGIMPHLTVKRARFYKQAKDFSDSNNFNGCWVDYNNAKIFIRRNAGQQATVVSDTGDLNKLNPDYVPTGFHFCTPPVFMFNENPNLNVPNMSPVAYSPPILRPR